MESLIRTGMPHRWLTEDACFAYGGDVPGAATGSGSDSGAAALEADAVITIVPASDGAAQSDAALEGLGAFGR